MAGPDDIALGIWTAAGEVPTNWLDPLLTGPEAVIRSRPPYDYDDIEKLCRAIVRRIHERARARQRDAEAAS